MGTHIPTPRTSVEGAGFVRPREFGIDAAIAELGSLASNPELGSEVREQLIGVLATWHNTELAEEDG